MTCDVTIMQGRMLPPEGGLFQCFPIGHWQEEITLAAKVPLNGIEWIYDLQGEGKNPLESDAGVEQLRALTTSNGIYIRSLCADYFMDRPVLRIDDKERRQRSERLQWLIKRCAAVGISRIVLPFVDASRIENHTEEEIVVAFVREALPAAELNGVELHLETSLEPSRFASLLQRLDNRMVKANYDSGNSASLGYHPRDEFNAYGRRVGSVHIKDRVRGGGTVPLGTGSADFVALRECLKEIGYDRDFVLQVARGKPGGELEWARANKQFVMNWWNPDAK